MSLLPLRHWGVAAALLALGGSTVLVAAAVTRSAAAQAGLPPAPPSTITVVGEGEARGTPDLAYITIGVQTQGATAMQASEENNRRMAAVLDALRARGVAAQDIQTSGLSITPQYRSVPPPPAPSGAAPMPVPGPTEPSGYQANNSVTVTVQQVERAGELFDAALAASANQLGGLRFGLKDPSALRQQAMSQALQNAQAKAEHLAGQLGLRVVGISSVTEEAGATPYAVPEVPAAPALAYGPPIESGTLRVSARVRVAFQFQ